MKLKIVKILQLLLGVLIFIDLVLLSTSVVLNFSIDIYYKMITFDVIVSIILLSDYFAGYFKAKNKRKYVEKNWLLLIASIPLDVIFFSFLPMYYLSLIRLVRILFLIGLFFQEIGTFLKNTRLDEILAILIIVIFGSTMALYLVEPSMTNLLDIFWFVIASVTTVGYGDITPVSVYGKIISIILLIIGVFIFSAITGAISTYFMDGLLQEGSYHIYEMGKKMDDMESKLDKNEETIKELLSESFV